MSEKNTSPMISQKVPLLDKFIWCIQGFVSMFPWIIIGYYLLYFYTDIVKMSPALAGTIMFGARMFDAVTDILIGWCIDNFHLRWGKFRSWVLLSLPFSAILWPMTWTCIDGAPFAVNLIFVVVGYGMLGAVGNTLYYIPINCQLVVMTKDEGERANMIGWKSVASNLASVAAVAMFMPIVNAFGGSNMGYFIAAVIIDVAYVFLLWTDFWMSKKYELTEDGKWKPELEIKKTKEGKRIPLGTQLAQLFQNKPAVIVVIGIVILNIVTSFRNAALVYVFEYYFETPEMATPALTGTTIAMVVGALAMQPSIKICRGTNKAYLAWILLTGASYVLFYVMARTMEFSAAQDSLHYGALFWVFVIGGFFTGAYYNFYFIELPMCCDYGVWKYDRDQTGLIYSLNGFTLTAGTAVGGFLLGIVLQAMGYVEGMSMDDSMKAKLLFVGIMAPVILLVVHLITQAFFGLSDEKYEEIIEEIHERGILTSEEKQALEQKQADEAAMAAAAAAEQAAAPETDDIAKE